MKSKNKKRSKEEVISEYKALAAQYGNFVFSFDVQKSIFIGKFNKLTQELEGVSAIEAALKEVSK